MPSVSPLTCVLSLYYTQFQPEAPMPAKTRHQRSCSHTNADGRRCGLRRAAGYASLCLHHRRGQPPPLAESPEAQQLVAQFLGSQEEFKTATAVNHALGNLFALLARGQVPVRKAAVLAYIAQLLLGTLPAVKRELTQGRGPEAWERTVLLALGHTARKSSSPERAETTPHPAAPLGIR